MILDEAELACRLPTDLLALDEALAGWRPRIREGGQLVKLRYFAGLTVERGRRRPWHLAPHRLPLLGLRPRLAALRGVRRRYRRDCRPSLDSEFSAEDSCSRPDFVAL